MHLKENIRDLNVYLDIAVTVITLSSRTNNSCLKK